MPERTIRILQLIDGLTVGGAERVVLTLAAHMRPERFKVIPCALRRSGPLEEDMKTAGIQYRVLGIARRSILTGPLFVLDFWRTLRALIDILREFSIDIVHTHLTESTLLGVCAARCAGIPRVCVTVHSTTFYPRRGPWSPRGWLMHAVVDKVFSQADRVIAVSAEVAQMIQSRTRIPSGRVVTIPNGVDSSQFLLSADQKVLRQRLGLPVDRSVVVTVGRLVRAKGYSYLLGALAALPAQRRPLTLFVGDGPDRAELERKVATTGLSFDVQFLGTRHDVPALLAAADLFVLSSLWEGLSLALLEAMASGLPTVVTSVGGNPEVVEDGKSGLLVPATDERALAEALSTLLQDPGRRWQMGQAARARFEQRFSLRSFVEAHERLYGEMLTISNSGGLCSVSKKNTERPTDG